MPLNERNGNATCTILIVENSDDVRAGLAKELESQATDCVVSDITELEGQR